jgi:hypothetical protein
MAIDERTIAHEACLCACATYCGAISGPNRLQGIACNYQQRPGGREAIAALLTPHRLARQVGGAGSSGQPRKRNHLYPGAGTFVPKRGLIRRNRWNAWASNGVAQQSPWASTTAQSCLKKYTLRDVRIDVSL